MTNKSRQCKWSDLGRIKKNVFPFTKAVIVSFGKLFFLSKPTPNVFPTVKRGRGRVLRGGKLLLIKAAIMELVHSLSVWITAVFATRCISLQFHSIFLLIFCLFLLSSKFVFSDFQCGWWEQYLSALNAVCCLFSSSWRKEINANKKRPTNVFL